MKRTVIILPTYNERRNIAQTIQKLLDNFKKIKDYDMHILVVDDNSPDLTWQIVKHFESKHDNVHLLRRSRKNGLGTAYIAGFYQAIEKYNADAVMQMDADMSHNPEDVPRFMEALADADVVIGSRYVPGGLNPAMTKWRKFVSRGGNFLATKGLGVKLNDCTSGFRAIKTEQLKRLNFERFGAKGYVFLVELLFNLYKKGSKIKEIPIRFDERLSGSSKLGKKDIYEFAKTIVRLRLRF